MCEDKGKLYTVNKLAISSNNARLLTLAGVVCSLEGGAWKAGTVRQQRHYNVMAVKDGAIEPWSNGGVEAEDWTLEGGPAAGRASDPLTIARPPGAPVIGIARLGISDLECLRVESE
ncbi:hypothetical protein E2562_025963 [Oryza meyeriana var. granulata]|uniref:Uncharacterized protein n=1 Tax=Oryza meyeriana var. granulata TaxID=110450 RepID=A0A6G1EZ21_9ORYZ|nr:hypothetical protein E2562_025963 [Oryza meyeriana var. granulata]